MPTYEYECTKCGKAVELSQPITEPPRRRLKRTDPKPCDCDAAVTRRIGTGGGIIFKGSGFYQTDYRSESYRQAAKADKEGGGNGKAKKDETAKKDKTGAKPETTSTPAK